MIGVGLVLMLISMAALVLGPIDRRRRRNRQARELARRRHPSARPVAAPMSDRERRYHESNQFGR